MALQLERWEKDIQKNLYANNDFLKKIGKDDSDYVHSKTVHLPQSGSKPGVEKDRSLLPAAISQRSDSELLYNLSEYSTNPFLINQNDDVQYLSYDKRMDVLGDHIATLSDAIANHTLFTWSATANGAIVRTTGASGGDLVHSTATGTRKLCTQADIQNARKIIDSQNLGAGQVYMIVPAAMFWNDFMSIASFTKYLEFGRAVLPTGDLPEVLGMKILVRSSTQAYDQSGTPARKVLLATGSIAAPAATDNNSIMVVHQSYVRKAMGDIKFYEDMGNPLYYGDLYSAQVFHGASKSRTNGEGIVQIVQAP